MSDTVITVENLSKKYLLTHLADKREQLFSRLLVNKVKTAGSKVLDMFRSAGAGAGEQTTEEFWALKDVSFEIKQGDRVGLIGRNGAGKSTLLKILSRITEPTRGRITIDGRVASLLEVGTGFHSELSGRENIYLNGAILGMSREEIKRKFDEIVAFSEVEKFLDTPVKRYSSGMYVRLAFAVAAHLEPEILIVDEVLAVGDAQFQKKCLGKMEDVSTKEGRTVLFVSHDMQAISSFTKKVIFLKQGAIDFIGNTFDGIDHYLSDFKSAELVYIAAPELDRPTVTKVELITSLPNNVQENGKELRVILNINMPKYEEGIAIAVHIKDLKGKGILHFSIFDGEPEICRKAGENTVELLIPNLRMYMGKYNISVHVAQIKGTVKYETLIDICQFEVVLYHKEHGYRWQEDICSYIEDYKVICS